MKLHVLGIDLGKTVFHLVGLDSTGKGGVLTSFGELQPTETTRAGFAASRLAALPQTAPPRYSFESSYASRFLSNVIPIRLSKPVPNRRRLLGSGTGDGLKVRSVRIAYWFETVNDAIWGLSTEIPRNAP
jgi:hypothetical protein